jgi:hypothetical protein
MTTEVKNTGIFIHDNEGLLIEVTDFPAAMAQAKECVKMHDLTKRNQNKEEGYYYFPDAHKRWMTILNELEKLAMKNPNLLSI